MATFLDIGLFEAFSPVFAFLFVWVTVFAVLQFTKFLGDNKGLHALFAFILAVLTMLSPKLVQLIGTMAPIFVVAIIFIVFLLLLYKMFGVDDDWLTSAIKGKGSAFYWILIVAAVIVVGSVSIVFGEEILSITQGGDGGNTTGVVGNLGSTLFHPKVLGFVVLMLIAVFAIYMLASKVKE